MALSEARLILAKMLWHFDMELDGEHPTWVEDARFFVSSLLEKNDVKSKIFCLHARPARLIILAVLTQHLVLRMQVLWELQPLAIKLKPVKR